MLPILLASALAGPVAVVTDVDALRQARSRDTAPPCAPGTDWEQGRCGRAVGVWAPPLPEASPSGYAQAHADIAEVFGYVSIHCPIPDAPEGRLVGQFSQRIHNGWYSNVETRLEGIHTIETQLGSNDEGRPIFQSLHTVRWSATEPGQAVQCIVEPIERVPVTVVVREEHGQPVVGAKVYGCGIKDKKTDSDGTVEAHAYDFAPCRIKSYAGRGGRYGGHFDPEEDAGTSVRLKPSPVEPSDYDPAAGALESRGMLEVYEGLLPLTTTPQGEKLLEHLVRHRKRMVALQECHAGDREQCVKRGPVSPLDDRLPEPIPQ